MLINTESRNFPDAFSEKDFGSKLFPKDLIDHGSSLVQVLA